MRGASAIQELLNTIPDTQLTVLVVWEPILWTDFKRPSASTLARLADRRVVQFWDHDHLVAKAFRDTFSSKEGKSIDPDRLSSDILWDDVAVYAPGLRWTDQQPQPDYFDGPVYDVIPKVKEALQQPVMSQSR